MTPADNPDSRSGSDAGRRRHLRMRRRLHAALLLLGALLAVGVVSGLGWAVRRIDEAALQVQQSQVLGTLDEYRERLRDAANSELQWDEAVRKLDLAFDPAWADSNLTTWLAESQGIHRIIVYDREDRPIYASIDGARTDPSSPDGTCADGPLLRALREREAQRGPLPRPAPANDVLISAPIDEVAFGLCEGEPVLVVATLVQPDYGTAMPGGARAPIVVLRRRLGQPVADRVAAALMLSEARIEPVGSQPRDASTLGLLTPDGVEVARFAWRPENPGRTLAAEAAPFVGLGAAGLLALTLLVLLRLRHTQDLVREAAARAERHAESLERMSALSGIGAWEAAPAGGMLQVSRETARVLGAREPGAMPMRDLLARLRAEAAGRLENALGDCLRFGAPFELLAEMQADGGRARILRIRGHALATPGGRGVEGTLQDVTEQVEQQRVQRRNTALLERMSRLADIGGWEYDLATRVLTFTEQSYRIYGLEPGSPVTLERIAALYDPDDARTIRETLRRALRDGTPWALELSPTTADGRRIRVRGLGEAESANGRVQRLFGTLQDTTVAHEAAARLREAMRRAEDRNAEIQQFTFAASHDLQEPVRKVQALGSLLLARHGAQLDEAGRDCVVRMQRSCERMAVLVDDVLAYSRAALRPPQPQPVALDTLAREVAEDLESLVARAGGRLALGPLPEIEGDRLQLRRMLQNLVENAFKYRHPARAPEVAVSASTFMREQSVPWVRLSVEDNGLGFADRHAEAIFLPFTRVQGDREGSGIGLAIVRRIAEGHGGRVFAQGRPGDGARFVVELPCRQPRGGGAAEAASPPRA